MGRVFSYKGKRGRTGLHGGLQTDVEGLDILGTNLTRLFGAIEGVGLDQATEEAAKVFEELQTELAPVDNRDLRGSIARARNAKGTTHSEWDSGPGKRGFYGMFQELGTIFHPAQPFQRPAFDEGSGTAELAFKAKMFNRIKRVLIRG